MIREVTLLITAIVVFIGFNVAINQKQQILSTGDPLLLKFTPSKISNRPNDNIVMRFDIEDQIKQTKVNLPSKSGYLVITLDNDHIGHFTRYYQGEVLKPNEKLIKYRYSPDSSRKITVAPNHFFFQEGLKPYFEDAQYALFHYRGDKEYVLVGLADSQGNKIKPPRMARQK